MHVTEYYILVYLYMHELPFKNLTEKQLLLLMDIQCRGRIGDDGHMPLKAIRDRNQHIVTIFSHIMLSIDTNGISNLEKLPVTGNAETNDPIMLAAPGKR